MAVAGPLEVAAFIAAAAILIIIITGLAALAIARKKKP